MRMSRFMSMVRAGDAAGVVDVGFPGTPPRTLRFLLRAEGQAGGPPRICTVPKLASRDVIYCTPSKNPFHIIFESLTLSLKP
jgi:hypothetical protein